MIIIGPDKRFKIMSKLTDTSRMTEYLCREQTLQETCLLVKITDSVLAKRFTLFLEEKIRRPEFRDYKECFQSNGVFYVVFTYSTNRKLTDKLSVDSCTGKERAEIARGLLEQMLIRSPHPYFMRNALKPDMITVSDSLDVDWNYHLEEVMTFDYCTMEAVCLQLSEVIGVLFNEELNGKRYPLLKPYLLALEEGKISTYLELYQEFMPVYKELCEEETGDETRQTFLQRLWKKCGKIVEKPDSLKGYFAIGKRYVAKKLTFVLVPTVILLAVLSWWIAYPWVESQFLTKTMVFGSEETQGYTGKVRLVGDLETDNVIFIGALTEGRFSGQGTLYDSEGNLKYRGEFLEDQYSGMGESYYGNGNVEYSGQFAAGRYEGSGTLYYPDGGIRYLGSFFQGLYDGTGTLFYENGVTSYEGEFFQGKKSGSGKEYDERGELLYEGAFSQGQYEGEGILYHNDQAVCQGSFHLGVLTSGNGIIYDTKGWVLYRGDIQNGQYDGQGKLYSGGILIYEGGFAEGSFQGSGKEYQKKTGMLLYDGMYDQGKYSGEGRLYDEITGGLLYEGSFYQGIYDGEGKLYDPATGELIYEGGFREGKYDGQGRSYVAGLLAYEGEFLLGTYNGRGILYDQATGAVVYEGVFYNNLPMTVPDGEGQENQDCESL